MIHKFLRICSPFMPRGSYIHVLIIFMYTVNEETLMMSPFNFLCMSVWISRAHLCLTVKMVVSMSSSGGRLRPAPSGSLKVKTCLFAPERWEMCSLKCCWIIATDNKCWYLKWDDWKLDLPHYTDQTAALVVYKKSVINQTAVLIKPW